MLKTFGIIEFRLPHLSTFQNIGNSGNHPKLPPLNRSAAVFKEPAAAMPAHLTLRFRTNLSFILDVGTWNFSGPWSLHAIRAVPRPEGLPHNRQSHPATNFLSAITRDYLFPHFLTRCQPGYSQKSLSRLPRLYLHAYLRHRASNAGWAGHFVRAAETPAGSATPKGWPTRKRFSSRFPNTPALSLPRGNTQQD